MGEPEFPTHDYTRFASDYAKREILCSDYVAFRDLPSHFTRLGVTGPALDLGCGAGRSTRYLATQGWEVTGVDRDSAMLSRARTADPEGDYQLAESASLPFADDAFNLVFSSFVLLEQRTAKDLHALLLEGARVLAPGGWFVVITNTPEFYRGTWLSCHVHFRENVAPLCSGQQVRVRLVPEGVELRDTFWSDRDYQAAFAAAGLQCLETHRPLGRPDDPLEWKDEKRLAPYVVYFLRRTG